MPCTQLSALQAAVLRHYPEKVTHTTFDFLTLYRTETGHEGRQCGVQVGYDSPSQFSRDYKRIFGRPPQSDLNHIRRIGVETYKKQHEDVWF